MRDLVYSIRVNGYLCRLSAGVDASGGCYVLVDRLRGDSQSTKLSRAELREFARACIRMLDEQEGPVMDGWDLKAEERVARLDVRSGGDFVSLALNRQSLEHLGRAASSLLKSAADEQPSAHDNPPPPQTYRGRIADLERERDEARAERKSAAKRFSDLSLRAGKELNALRKTLETERAHRIIVEDELSSLKESFLREKDARAGALNAANKWHRHYIETKSALETERKAAVAAAEELERVRRELADLRERVEAETNQANVAGARLVVARADYGVLLAPARSRLESLLYGEGQDDVPEGLDVLLTAAADEIEHGRELELEATVEREARRCLEDVERERDAAIARADALAARLAEVEDREHPA